MWFHQNSILISCTMCTCGCARHAKTQVIWILTLILRKQTKDMDSIRLHQSSHIRIVFWVLVLLESECILEKITFFVCFDWKFRPMQTHLLLLLYKCWFIWMKRKNDGSTDQNENKQSNAQSNRLKDILVSIEKQNEKRKTCIDNNKTGIFWLVWSFNASQLNVTIKSK